jgi:MoxR-like ATPase
LPAAQLDRFFMKIYFGYVDEEAEMNIYRQYLNISQNLITQQQVITLAQLLWLQEEASKVFIHDELIRGVNHIVRATRNHPDIVLGASIRSGIAFLKCLKAFALIRGRTFVIEDDIAALAKPVLDHRLVYRNREGREQALAQIIKKESERLARLKLYHAS